MLLVGMLSRSICMRHTIRSCLIIPSCVCSTCRLNNILGATGSTREFFDLFNPKYPTGYNAKCNLHAGFARVYFNNSLNPSTGLRDVPPLRDTLTPKLFGVLDEYYNAMLAAEQPTQPNLIFAGECHGSMISLDLACTWSHWAIFACRGRPFAWRCHDSAGSCRHGHK